MAEMNPPKLALCIPTRDSVKAEAFRGLMWCASESAVWWLDTFPGADVSHYFTQNSHVAEARSTIANACAETGVDWMLWLDDDADPPRDLLKNLMASDKQFLAPTFFRKLPPYSPCCFEIGPRRADGRFDTVTCDPDPPRLFRADATGFHTVLMHRSVLVKVRERLGPKAAFFEKNWFTAEDIYFCIAAKAAGVELWIDSRIEVKHVGAHSFGKREYAAFRERPDGVQRQSEAATQHARESEALAWKRS